MSFSQTLKLCRDFVGFFCIFIFFAFVVFLFERSRRAFLHRNHDNVFCFHFLFSSFSSCVKHVTTFNVAIVMIWDLNLKP